MTTSVRFCLSYDLLKWDFIAFKLNIISIRKHIVDTDIVMTLCIRTKVLLYMWSHDFYDMTLFTELQRRHMILYFHRGWLKVYYHG